jgi:hypothetical protein
MADITLGQSINGSFTSSDPKNIILSPTNPLGVETYDREHPTFYLAIAN